jgi:hypothetical protein
MKTLLRYLKYSGLSVSLTFNPYHWQYVPKYFRNGLDGWDPDYHSVSFLFLTIRVWIDDGSW